MLISHVIVIQAVIISLALVLLQVDEAGEAKQLISTSKPPPLKKPKKGGDGGSKDQALELTESQE